MTWTQKMIPLSEKNNNKIIKIIVIYTFLFEEFIATKPNFLIIIYSSHKRTVQILRTSKLLYTPVLFSINLDTVLKLLQTNSARTVLQFAINTYLHRL